MIDDLIFDITVRFPKDRIVFRGDFYYVLEGDSGKFTHKIPEDVIDELITRNFAEKNKHGGLLLTNNIFLYSDSLPNGPTKKVESFKEKGQFYEVSIKKERWFPLIYSIF